VSRHRSDIDWDTQPIGQMIDSDLARKLGVSTTAVQYQRSSRGIAAFAPRERDDIDWARVGLGTKPDQVLAKELGVVPTTVRHQRVKRGIALYRDPAAIDWDAQPLGEMPDAALARKLGVTRSAVEQQRLRRGISLDDDDADETFDSIVHARVTEELQREEVIKLHDVLLDYHGGHELWEAYLAKGYAQPYGVLRAGRILIGPVDDPVAGLLFVREHEKLRITHVWVEGGSRRRGFGRALLELYQQYVTTRLYAVGPYSRGGRALLQAAGAVFLRK
jgi:GNAT superfamily N-acetyltransferase/DNA-binding CsgD family transcriptional regulator